jgi:hypothetical protein
MWWREGASLSKAIPRWWSNSIRMTGAVDPVVEDALLVRAAHPREVGFREVPLHLAEPYASVTGPDATDVGLHHVEQQALLAARQDVPAYSLVLELEVVAERRREHLAGKLGG